MIMIRVIVNYKEILDVLDYYSKDLEPIRAGRIHLEEMARKFASFGTVIELIEDEERIGFAAFYHNDRKLRRAFLSMIVILPEYQGKGYGSRLLAEVEHECVDDEMKILAVEVRTDNERAIKFYETRGFAVVNALSDIKVILEKELDK